MIAFMENTARKSVQPYLEDTQGTVGTLVNVKHVAATPVGMEVRAVAEVTAVEKNIITFRVEAFDEAGKIGEGTHKRAVVTAQRFLDKVYAKL